MFLSKYACIVTVLGNKYLLNTFNSALIVLDDTTAEKISNTSNVNLEKMFAPEEYSLLISEGFLVDEHEEERRLLSTKMDYHGSKYKPTATLKIDIGITDKCNFACPYCFENGNKNTQNFCPEKYTYSELFSELRTYILNRVNSGVKDVEIVWYGGEPSLEFDFICFANRKILSDSSTHNFRFGNIIITNGYCIDHRYVNVLKEQNVKYVQITIDGLSDTHNSRRNTVPKTDSFGKILTNIDDLLANDIEVVIRINVDTSNAAEICKLLDFLHQRFSKDLIGRLLFVDFGRVFGSKLSMSHNEYESVYRELYLKACSLGFIEPGFEVSPVGAFCDAETQNDNLVIDFMGNKYKCWNDIFNPLLTVGNVYSDSANLNADRAQEIEALYLERLSLDSTNGGKCLDCEFIKYCGGLCPYNRKLILNGMDTDIYINDVCKDIVKYRIETFIEGYLIKNGLCTNDD